MTDALQRHVQAGKGDLLPLIELLLTHGALPQIDSYWGVPSVNLAARLGRFDVVRRLLDAGASPELLSWTDLMHAIALGDIEDVRRELAKGARLAARDRWQHTPFLICVQTGDLEKLQLLIQAGADVNERSSCGETALMYATQNNHHEVVSWLIESGADLDARDDFGNSVLAVAAANGATGSVRVLLQAGARVDTRGTTDGSGQEARTELENRIRGWTGAPMLDSLPPTDPDTDADPFDRPGRPLEPTIRKAANLAIVRLLVEAGANLNDISDAMRAELTGLKTGGKIVCSNRHYAEGKNGRFGNANPEVMDIPFWRAMVQSGATAFAARDAFDDLRGRAGTPVWSHHRFGKSITELPDGRIIEIAGGHDVSHTPDFCIYNEVVVHRGDGQFDIYGYPDAVFPPTDFHSATLVGNDIYIIGSLGYPETRRPGETPVYRLTCGSLRMEKMETTGDNPGWICHHKAKLSLNPAGAGTITVSGGTVYEVSDDEENFRDNTQSFALDLTTLRWHLQKELGA